MGMDHTVGQLQERLASFMYRVYGLMATAFTITAATAYYVSITPAIFKPLVTQSGIFLAIIIVQFVLVILLSTLLPRMSFGVASALLIAYAASMGLTLSVIFLRYQMSSIYVTFFVSAGMFAAMAIYGYLTHTDLSSIGNIMLMALVGLIIGMVINLFLRNMLFEIILSSVGVIIFTALTAYDSQRIKYIGRLMLEDGQEPAQVAVFGALTLYLDFINLFLYMLTLTGRRRD
jgi:uncharacterized protein